MRLTHNQKIREVTDYGYQLGDAYLIVQKLGQLEDIEERLGIDLVKYLKLQLDGGYFKVPKKVVEEFCTSFKPNQIVNCIPDNVSPEGITLTYYDKWDNTCEPIKYLYSWANEGNSWASTKEELTNEN